MTDGIMHRNTSSNAIGRPNSSKPSKLSPDAYLSFAGSCSLGTPIPPHTIHAVSVMFPTWKDNVLYEEGDEATHKALQTGYPRFVYHRFVRKLFDVCRDKFAQFDETCMVFPSRKAATQCKAWIKLQSPIATVRVVEQRLITENVTTSTECMPAVTLYIVVLPLDAARIAKTFWQHSGNIITSRQAEHCLSLMNANERVMLDSIGEHMLQQRARNPLYFAKGPLASSPSTESSPVEGKDLDDYVEQRFGRILDVSMADKAKRLLRRRIAGVVSPDQDDPVTDPVDRGVVGLTEDHVYLLPCGMNAIFTAFVIASRIYPQRKSVQFGFPYLDTLKILEKFGPGCHFFGHGDEADFVKLEALLKTEKILCVMTEFPSNPLCKSPDLRRLRALADEHDFLLLVDETVGTFVNVNVLPYADMVMSSLTKLFSGDSNVMGGSIVVNPSSRYLDLLTQGFKAEYKDIFWCEDAVYLERNSRDFKKRSILASANAERLADALKTHPKIKTVFYPKYTTRETYDQFKRSDGGYGSLLSVVFHKPEDAIGFYDSIRCAKGPSLGTNFTLASPYVILAHYGELEWAESFGVDRHLVRISVGLEDFDQLLHVVGSALE